jgi:Mg/Co/Ni transporter MgtE
MNAPEVKVYRSASAFDGGKLCVAATFDDYPVLMGMEIVREIIDVIAKRYVEENYEKIVAQMTPADILAMVQTKSAKSSCNSLSQIKQKKRREVVTTAPKKNR